MYLFFFNFFACFAGRHQSGPNIKKLFEPHLTWLLSWQGASAGWREGSVRQQPLLLFCQNSPEVALGRSSDSIELVDFGSRGSKWRQFGNKRQNAEFSTKKEYEQYVLYMITWLEDKDKRFRPWWLRASSVLNFCLITWNVNYASNDKFSGWNRSWKCCTKKDKPDNSARSKMWTAVDNQQSLSNLSSNKFLSKFFSEKEKYKLCFYDKLPGWQFEGF